MGISQLFYLKVTFNICYSSSFSWRGMLISLISHTELWLLVTALQVFILAFVRQHMGERLKLMPLKSSQFKSISYLFSPKSQCLSGTYKSAECMAPSVLRPSAFSLLKLGAWHGKLPLASETCKQVIVTAFEIWRGTGWMFFISVQ